MKREGMKSSNIVEMGYDKEKQILEVVFKSGGTYQYLNVDPKDVESLKTAPSVGKRFHELKKSRGWDYNKMV